jgi:hypothetical protein
MVMVFGVDCIAIAVHKDMLLKASVGILEVDIGDVGSLRIFHGNPNILRGRSP